MVEVVGVDVVLVDDEDVVVAGWQTEMFTVPPLPTSWPEPGLWLSTWPAVAPFAHAVSVVVLATSPAPLMADCAAVAD